MPLTRQEKEALTARYEKTLAAVPNIILMDFAGISVPEVTELRNRVREAGGSYEVIKNRLMLRAISGSPLDGLKDHFRGATAVAYGEADPVTLAKVLTDFAKGVPAIRFKAGLVEGQRVEADEVRQIASLPAREELIAKLLFLLQSPITGLARVLGAHPQRWVAVLEQIRRLKGAGGSGG